MASSNEIPDLKTLLGQSRGGGLRGRARGRGGFASSDGKRQQVRDDAVKATDQDAAGSRMSCVELGYLHDPFAKYFTTQQTSRRLPLLNRGTYVRTSAIDLLITQFLDTDPSSPKQIISLGAGTDTRYFRLLNQYPSCHLIYHEIDFPSNTIAKIAAIQNLPPLYWKPLPITEGSTSYHSEDYNIHALDLRDLSLLHDGASPPELPNLKSDVATLILSEMCLVYLQPKEVQMIMQSLLTQYLKPATPAALVLYEPILPADAFGRTMISNLQSRNIHLPTLTAYPHLGDQRARLQGYGFKGSAKAVDTSHIWRSWVPEEEKQRVASLEFLDELEELELLLQHYCIAWGSRDGDSDVFTRAWADVKDGG